MAEGISVGLLSIEPRVEEIRQASSWLNSRCMALGVPETTIERIDVSVNEALANTLAHGSSAVQTRPIEIRVKVQGGATAGCAEVEVHDGGVAFDPTAYASQKIASSLAEASVGGLGLTLIRHNTDTLQYNRSGGINVLKLGFVWPRLGDDRGS